MGIFMQILLAENTSLTEMHVVNAHPIKVQRGGTWKDKNLNCEIETLMLIRSVRSKKSWKDKNLNCEIETYITLFVLLFLS